MKENEKTKNNSKTKPMVIVIIIVFIVLLVVGGSVAFYSASKTNDNSIKGGAYNFNVGINITTETEGTGLVPVDDTDITKAITATTPCVDSNGDKVCGIYKVDITNNGDPATLYGFVSTNNSTFTTQNLKYQVFIKSDTTYTASSDIAALSNTADEKVYFKKGSNNSSIGLATKGSPVTYYLVFWISNINGDQNADAGKTFNGAVGVETPSGAQTTASFTVGS